MFFEDRKNPERPATSSKVLPERIWADQATLEDYQRNTLIWRKKDNSLMSLSI
jgi:hypothetical protein